MSNVVLWATADRQLWFSEVGSGRSRHSEKADSRGAAATASTDPARRGPWTLEKKLVRDKRIVERRLFEGTMLDELATDDLEAYRIYFDGLTGRSITSAS
jgi:hypothetical protein